VRLNIAVNPKSSGISTVKISIELVVSNLLCHQSQSW